MDLAFCVEDDAPWDARLLSDEAKRQPSVWLAKRRPTFICAGCEKKARFVYSTKRIPHFGLVRGYKHDDDCDFLEDPTGRNNGPGNPLPDRDPAEGNKEVSYSKLGPLNPTATGGTSGNNGGLGNGGKQSAAIGPLHETTGLRTLLRNLRNRHDYPPANLWLNVPARGTAVRATDYFYKIADITQQTPRDPNTRAFWGKITTPSDDGDGKNLWINCDGKGSLFTIWMYPDLKDELYKSLGIKSASKLHGAHVIVEGTMNQSKKLTVRVTDLKMIAFLPKR